MSVEPSVTTSVEPDASTGRLRTSMRWLAGRTALIAWGLIFCGIVVLGIAAWEIFAVSNAGSGQYIQTVVLACAGVLTVCIGALWISAVPHGTRHAIASARARARIASEVAGIGYWEFDTVNGELVWEETMHRIYGTDPAVFRPTGEGWKTLLHADDQPRAMRNFERAILEGIPYDDTYRIVRRDGAERIARSVAKMVIGKNGEVVRALGMHWDITEQTVTAGELESTARRLSLAMRAAEIGLWNVDLVTKQITCDDTLHVLLGYEPGALDGTLWESLCHPADLGALRAACLAYLNNIAGSFQQDYRVRTSGGEWVWVHDAGEVVERDSMGNAVRMMGVRVLVDEKKRTEDALRSVVSLVHREGSSGAFSEIARAIAEAFDVMYVGIARFTDAGTEAQVIGGWLKGEPATNRFYSLAGTPCDLLSGRSYCFYADDVRRLFPADTDLERMGAHGYAGVQIVSSRGKPIGVLHIVHDAPLDTKIDFESVLRLFAARTALEIERSEVEVRLRTAKAEAERANSFKSEFLANVSHEIRTPIQALLGFADLLAEPGDKDPGLVRDYAGTISRNGNHLLALVNDLLDTSKIEAGQMKIESIETRTDELVSDVWAMLRPRGEAKGLRMAVECRGAVPETIRTDPVRLRQILVNLLGNAIKFTERGSVTLGVTYDAPGDCVSFAFEDTGIGIESSQVRALFMPFTQADRSTTRRFGGTGLGLSISKRLAELMGGCLTARSEPGGGSVFEASVAACLPPSAVFIEPAEFERRCAVISGARRNTGDGGTRLRGLRILLAEDSVDNQRLLRFMLEREGAELEVVANGQAALDMLGVGGRFDMVITDMQMPVLDGYAFARAARNAGFTLPIVALTAHATSDDESRCLSVGCTVYETKPVTRERLVLACLRAIGEGAGGADAA